MCTASITQTKKEETTKDFSTVLKLILISLYLSHTGIATTLTSKVRNTLTTIIFNRAPAVIKIWLIEQHGSSEVIYIMINDKTH